MSNCIFLLVPFYAYRADCEDYINIASVFKKNSIFVRNEMTEILF